MADDPKDIRRPVAFRKGEAQRIADAVRSYERGNKNRPARRGRYPVGGDGDPLRIAKTGAGGIDMMDTLTPGSATVTLYDFDGSTIAAGDDVTCYNLMSGDVSANTFIIVGMVAGGYYFVVAEACP
jgi:hypothetical protein